MKIGGFRAAIATLFSFVLIVSTGLPAQSKDSWRPDDPSFFGPKFAGFQVDFNNGRDLFLIEEEGERTFGQVYHVTNDRVWTVCEDLTSDFNCGKPSGGYVTGRVILPLCGDVVENCIESLSVGTSTSMVLAEPKGTSFGFNFKGVPEKSIPSSTGVTYFDSAVPHSSGNRYAVVAQIDFSIDSGRVGFNALSTRVFPVREESSNLPMPKITICQGPAVEKGASPCLSEATECAYQVPGTCAKRQEFAADTRFAVSLRLSNAISGWFRGRLKSPEVEVKPINADYSSVAVSGEPVEVPRLIAGYVAGQDGPPIAGSQIENSYGGAFTIFKAASSRAIDIVNGVRAVAKDTAVAQNSIWMVNSITAGTASGGGQGSQCLQEGRGLLGIVTTNAMAYTGTIPDYKSGYLSYRVAGMHFLPDGKTEALGTYDLVMRSDVARCLYGFTNAPVSATIQVVGTGGEEKVATTIVNEKDGWLKLAAYGFTFSEKEIRVTLDQVKVAVPKTLNLPKFTGKTTQLRLEQRWAIEDFVKASENTKSVTCTAMFVSSSDRARALTRARVACNNAKLWNSAYVVKTAAKQTKTKSLDGRVVMSSR
jgi:hypothetical protein